MHLFAAGRPQTNGRPLLLGSDGSPIGPIPIPYITFSPQCIVVSMHLLVEQYVSSTFSTTLNEEGLLRFLSAFQSDPELCLKDYFGYSGVLKKHSSPKPSTTKVTFTIDDL